MDFRYFNFCQPGGPFYDVPDTASSEGDFAAANASLPAGWRRSTNDDWVVLTPPGVQLPLQGWKIHVSATPENAEKIIEVVSEYCLPRKVTFKFIRGSGVLMRRNSKYGDRGSSGKFVTVYPLDEAHLAEILTELGELLDGEPGPYILSDLRWRSGPLYVRYGGFVAHLVRCESGELVHCIQDPDGKWVPDVRGPGFRPPAWVALPACLEEPLAARNAGTLDDFPFRPTKALHFSNGGGVYEATDIRSGDVVLLKEARPLAGLDAEGADALERLRREHWALQRLEGLDCMPALVDFRKGREHYFLTREFVEGQPLAREMQQRNPLLVPRTPTADDLADYAQWAQSVLDQVERGIQELHERGVVFGDLHPNNVLIRPDGTIAFIDLEASREPGSAAQQALAAPGFQAPAGYSGPDIDRYALGCLRLGVFFPLTQALPWSPAKADQFIELIASTFPVPADYAEQVRRDLGPAIRPDRTEPAVTPQPLWPVDGPGQEDWPTLREGIAEGILAAATPERDDRLYPGDIEQFHGQGGGVNFAYGASGVLWALVEAGLAVPDDHIDWLTNSTSRLTEPHPGFYDGLSGVAYTLDRLGRTQEARELLGRVADLPDEDADHSLFSGRAGIGLTLLYFARRDGESAFLEHAVRLADRITGQAERASGLRQRPGLMHGRSGSALFLLRLYEQTQDRKHLVQGVDALRHDLALSGWASGQPVAQDAPWRTPVLTGGAGMALVLHELLAHAPDPELAKALDDLCETIAPCFFAHAGLFTGRAGAVLARHQLHRSAGQDDPLRQHLAAFGWHAIPHAGNLAFLGDQCLRLSTDLATGAAGVLFAVDAVLGGKEFGLPFLTPRPGGQPWAEQ
ncbi:class III lanthionine synthetase LanKC [Streptomyces chrestomyceticus]|uniref:class III lanthionine synthetase LanKC n=1 Tax=Streptomyces chrestomyceticus TaxID=68185 RepID=UPI0004C8C76A